MPSGANCLLIHALHEIIACFCGSRRYKQRKRGSEWQCLPESEQLRRGLLRLAVCIQLCITYLYVCGHRWHCCTCHAPMAWLWQQTAVYSQLRASSLFYDYGSRPPCMQSVCTTAANSLCSSRVCVCTNTTWVEWRQRGAGWDGGPDWDRYADSRVVDRILRESIWTYVDRSITEGLEGVRRVPIN